MRRRCHSFSVELGGVLVAAGSFPSSATTGLEPNPRRAWAPQRFGGGGGTCQRRGWLDRPSGRLGKAPARLGGTALLP